MTLHKMVNIKRTGAKIEGSKLLLVYLGLCASMLGGCQGSNIVDDPLYMDSNLVRLKSVELSQKVMEESGMRKVRKLGDRILGEPDLSENSEIKRAITQYDTIDRPILVNTLRGLIEYDLGKIDFSEGTQLVTDGGSGFLNYKENTFDLLGDPIPESTKLVTKLAGAPPGAPEVFTTYLTSVVNVLTEGIEERESAYNSVTALYTKYEDATKYESSSLENACNTVETLATQTENIASIVTPYIDEMDVVINNLREQIGEKRKAYPYVISKDGFSDLSHISERDPVADFVEFQENKYGGYKLAIINKDKIGQDLTANSILGGEEREPDKETEGEPDKETEGEPTKETEGEPNE